jgi:hypothetical protein
MLEKRKMLMDPEPGRCVEFARSFLILAEKELSAFICAVVRRRAERHIHFVGYIKKTSSRQICSDARRSVALSITEDLP